MAGRPRPIACRQAPTKQPDISCQQAPTNSQTAAASKLPQTACATLPHVCALKCLELFQKVFLRYFLDSFSGITCIKNIIFYIYLAISVRFCGV
jgi:hypothetical protein